MNDIVGFVLTCLLSVYYRVDPYPTMLLKFNNDLFVFRIVSLTHLDYPIASWGTDTTQGT